MRKQSQTDALVLIDIVLIAFISRAFVWVLGGLDPRALEEDATGAWYIYLLGVIYLYVTAYLIAKSGTFIRVLKTLSLYWVVVAFCLASVAWSIDSAATLQRAVSLLGTSLFAIYLYVRYGGHGTIRVLAITYLLISIAFLAVSIALPLYGVHMDGDNAGNWRGVFEHKNTAAYALLIGVFSGAYMCIRSRRYFGVWGMVTLLSSVSVAMTMSRTTVICILLTALLLLFINALRRQRRLRGPLVVIAVLTFSGSLLALGAYLEDILSFLGRDLTLTGRTTIWYAAYLFWIESPWIGHGYQASWRVYEGMPSYVELVAGWAFNPSHSHNAYIDVALGVGVIGLALYSLFLFRALSRGIAIGIKNGALEPYWAIGILVVNTLIGFSGRVIMQPNTIQLVVMLVAAMIILERKAIERA